MGNLIPYFRKQERVDEVLVIVNGFENRSKILHSELEHTFIKEIEVEVDFTETGTSWS
jgi:hypothetical protein